MASAKAKGTRKEHQSKKLLEKMGYTVFRMAGSHGAFDLIAIGETDVLLCQVKTRDWPSGDERRLLESMVVPRICKKIAHRWRDGETIPDMKVYPQGEGHRAENNYTSQEDMEPNPPKRRINRSRQRTKKPAA